MASCHLLCSLWPWPETDGGAKPLYDRTTSIEGLTSNPDRTLLAFVESREVIRERAVPHLVVLDAATFEPLQRLKLPVGPDTLSGVAVVSMSPDGQRILVAIDPPPRSGTPRTTFLVDDALTAEPQIRRVDFRGVVQWHPGDV